MKKSDPNGPEPLGVKVCTSPFSTRVYLKCGVQAFCISQSRRDEEGKAQARFMARQLRIAIRRGEAHAIQEHLRQRKGLRIR